jgi:regulator of protease activity HflC (stomatin/prohibitin superfamily)
MPATLGELTIHLAATWLLIALLSLVMSLFSLPAAIAGAIIFIAVSAATAQQLWVLLRARQRVLSLKNVPLIWGCIRLIAWDPVEGVLILRNKRVEFCDDNLTDGCGGVRFLYPILGEELALLAPLEVQTLSFRDENVLTREYLSVTIRGTMKWRIADLRKFYLLVSRELRSTTNEDDRESISRSTRPLDSGGSSPQSAMRQLLRAAIGWMQVLVEEETRTVVSRARTGLLIADRLSQELFPQVYEQTPAASQGTAPSQGSVVEWGGAADGLAGAIHDTIARRLEAYGIAVEDVSLQELKLPEEVMRECIEACKAYYYPTLAKRKAAFAREELQAQTDVLGAEAVATRQIVGAAPAFALPDFLNRVLQARLQPAKNGDVAPAELGLAAVAAAAMLPQHPNGEAASTSSNGGAQ